jgi:hypothetical protein
MFGGVFGRNFSWEDELFEDEEEEEGRSFSKMVEGLWKVRFDPSAFNSLK